MSLILDALNRSRQGVGDIPGLESQHLVAEEAPGLRSRLWPLALVIALGVIAYLLYERGDESVPEPATVEKGEEQKTAPVPAQLQNIEPESRNVVVETSRPPAPIARPEPTAKLEPPASPSPKLRQPAAPDAAVAALYGAQSDAVEAPAQKPDKAPVEQVIAEPVVRKPVATEEPVDIERIVQRAQEELADARLEEHEAPFLASLSQQSKNDIPTIFYERHDYSGKPGQSSVVLNGKEVKPGGKTRGGVRVDEILADSVVLSYRGTQFRLRALNSWVNL